MDICQALYPTALYPMEGIDKIKVVLNPRFLNPSFFSHIDPKNHLTLHRESNVKALSVHAEFINPLEDMRITLAKALYELITNKKIPIILRPNIAEDQLVPYLIDNLETYILYVQELEFFFNFKEEHITIIPQDPNQVSTGNNKKLGIKLFKKGNMPTPTKTQYTNDYSEGKRRSIGIIYDRNEKLLRDNHISHIEILKNPYKMRLEFRLHRNNCKYLALENLTGSYADIIERYRPLLATIYNRYFAHTISTTETEYQEFNQLKNEAHDNGRVRYTGQLKKTNSLSPDMLLYLCVMAISYRHWITPFNCADTLDPDYAGLSNDPSRYYTPFKKLPSIFNF